MKLSRLTSPEIEKPSKRMSLMALLRSSTLAECNILWLMARIAIRSQRRMVFFQENKKETNPVLQTSKLNPTFFAAKSSNKIH